MSVPDDKLQAIRERTDIVQLIGRCVALKKSGRNHVGLCPFHGEKSPSFSVSAQKNVYYCFGCHAGGDAIDFVMRHDGLDFHGAVRQLAQAANVELEPESPQVRARREQQQRIDQTNRHALKFFVQALWSEGGAPAKRYLGERRIPAVFARERSLGYGGADAAFRRFMRENGCDDAALGEAGLVNEDGRWALFQGRVVFPIFDLEGRLAGFGGRRLGDGKDPDAGPKYVNSRDTLLFSKRTLLYGLHDAQNAIRRSKRVVVVEGYTDVLAAQRAGVQDAVAALGTAFTAEHAQTLKRLATHAVLLLDADAAGQRAAREATTKLLHAGFVTLAGCLPPGQDPDSLVRAKGPEALQAVVDAAKPALEHFIDAAFENINSIEERAEAARGIQPLLSALPPGLERDLYMGRLAEKVGVPVDDLKKHLEAAARKAAQSERGARKNSRAANGAGSHAASRGNSGSHGHGAPPDNSGRAFGFKSERTGQPSQGPRMRIHPGRDDEPPPPGDDMMGPATDDANGRGQGTHDFFAAPGGPPEGAHARTSGRLRPERMPKGLEQELGMLRELLLFPQLRARFGELAEYMLHTASQDLTEKLADPDVDVVDAVNQHINHPLWIQRLCQISALDDAPLDEVNRQANRTFDDVLTRLKWRHVDAALTDVLRELREVEARGEATDELLRRKQDLTTRKRALGRTAKG